MDATNGVTPSTPVADGTVDRKPSDRRGDVTPAARERFTTLLKGKSSPNDQKHKPIGRFSETIEPADPETSRNDETPPAPRPENINATMAPPASAVIDEAVAAPSARGRSSDDGSGTGLLDIARRLSLATAELATPGPAMPTAAAGAAAPSAPEDVATLLQRFCSDMYVADTHAGNPRMLLGLDAAMPGAAAEFIRDGVYLRVRLLLKDEDLFKKMEADRSRLLTALAQSTPLQTTLDIVHQPASGRVDPGY